MVKTDFKIQSDVVTIFIGDSHIQQAINDSIIPNSINVAMNSESFYFSYYKLKLLLAENPAVKQVYLGLSYNSLSSDYDRSTSGERSAAIAPRYYFILPAVEQARLMYWNKNNLSALMKGVVKTGFNQSFEKNYYPFIGHYSQEFDQTTAVDSSMDKRIQLQYYEEDKLSPFSTLNIHYLHQIIELCKQKKVQLTTINTPLHTYYNQKVPKAYRSKLEELITKNQLDYMDLSKLPLSDNCFIPDGDHVSLLGATQTSIKIKEIIQERSTKGID